MDIDMKMDIASSDCQSSSKNDGKTEEKNVEISQKKTDESDAKPGTSSTVEPWESRFVYWGEYDAESQESSLDESFAEEEETTTEKSKFEEGNAAEEDLSAASSSAVVARNGFKFLSSEKRKEKTCSSCVLDPLVLHTIELMEFRRILFSGMDRPRKISPLPKMRDRPAFGETCRLTESEAYQSLRKSVAALSSHVGFQYCEAEALEVLVDVGGECMEKMCKILKKVNERRLLKLDCANTGELAQMLNIVGIGQVGELHSFYKKRIINPHQRILAECSELRRKMLSESEENLENV